MTRAPREIVSGSPVPTSLAGRLLAGSAVATVVVLAMVLGLVHQVLTRFVAGQIDQRLDNKIVALSSQIRVAPGGTLILDGEADGPPFDRPHHRAFWVVRGPKNELRTGWLPRASAFMPSAAEIEAAFARPVPPPPGPSGLATHPRTIEADGLGTSLHERVAQVRIGGMPVTILVAAPNEAIRGPVSEAMTRVGLAVLALGLGLAALAFAQVRLGLRPLDALRRQLAEVGDGRLDRLPARQPREIAPLVDEMNQLLAANAVNLATARRHVANLAHGLKTPLATLQLGVERLDGPGKEELRQLLTQIDLRVRHHLSRARAGALGGPERARTTLAPRLSDIGGALAHIHADRHVALTLEVPAELDLACEVHDVDEIFGNLLDNAFKFASERVVCTARIEGRSVRVTIADDGPGLSTEDIALVLQPGRRLDEQKPGFGFGLTIARELVELYGGGLDLSPGHRGLDVAVTLPVGAKVGRPRVAIP